MTITRRRLLKTSAGLLAATAAPRFAIAETAAGTGTVTSLSDGSLTLPASMIIGDTPMDQVQPILDKYNVSSEAFTPPCNLTLYQDGERTVLFDAGSGLEFMASAGHIHDSLDAVGLSADDITDIVFTHAHPDHLWGLLDDFGDIAFSEATFHIGRKEFEYWSDPETINTIGEARVPFAVGAKRRLDEIADVVQLFEEQDQILPNVTAMASFGHTPGHMSFMIDGEAGNAFVIGDAIGNHHIAFARPDLPSGSDQNAEEGIQTRVAMMDMLAADNVPIIGFHLPDGGMGRVARDGDGYVFNAE